MKPNDSKLAGRLMLLFACVSLSLLQNANGQSDPNTGDVTVEQLISTGSAGFKVSSPILLHKKMRYTNLTPKEAYEKYMVHDIAAIIPTGPVDSEEIERDRVGRIVRKKIKVRFPAPHENIASTIERTLRNPEEAYRWGYEFCMDVHLIGSRFLKNGKEKVFFEGDITQCYSADGRDTLVEMIWPNEKTGMKLNVRRLVPVFGSVPLVRNILQKVIGGGITKKQLAVLLLGAENTAKTFNNERMQKQKPLSLTETTTESSPSATDESQDQDGF